jgi:excisionase family DNA binding protein
LPALDLNQRYTLAETCDYLRISRPSLYKKIDAGEIRLIEEGARRFVPGTEIARNSTIAA